MSEKVIITRKQAEAIENMEPETTKAGFVKAHLNIGEWGGNMSPLNSLHPDKLIQALYIGYEVEPEFEEGQWATPKDLEEGCKVEIKPYKITEVEQDGRLTKVWLDCGYWFQTHTIYHSTPAEIAAEKERRKWAKIGRNPGELHKRDIVINTCHKEKELIEVKADYTTKKYDHLVMICPAENRLDINHD